MLLPLPIWMRYSDDFLFFPLYSSAFCLSPPFDPHIVCYEQTFRMCRIDGEQIGLCAYPGNTSQGNIQFPVVSDKLQARYETRQFSAI